MSEETDGSGVEVRWVVHGHFYQPPRENPWTEEIAAEPSAAPFHDWNERITAESYRPNGWARILDDTGRVTGIVDNYEYLSFDAGPTLMSWLDTHRPEVYRRIVDADRAGGGAIAHAYSHAILPLCNGRDLRTQTRWGLADFAHRFGRPAEGMWLPETAVNDEVLRVLAQEGVRFTILAPHQARGTVASGRPYRWLDPAGSGLSIDVVFYDGSISHDLAFGFTGMSSQELVRRVVASGRDGVPVFVATDGETFGHHHKFADRALAYAFVHEAAAASVRVLTAAQLVREEPAVETAGVHQSSWSCRHGIERWRSDCGCSSGARPGWNQRWRAPLRDALDLLRDEAAAVFARRGAEVLRDPWAARDAYVDVLLGRRSIDDLLAEHGMAGLDGDGTVAALTLLEGQRHSLLMYTSCGWFFDDLAGLETVQVLRYAARLLDLLDELDEAPPREAFLDRLAKAESNDPEEGTGADVWARHVVPARVDEARVVSHLALVELFEQSEPGSRMASFDIIHARRHRGRDGLSGCAGRVTLVHRRTRRTTEHVYAAVRLGGLDVYGATRAIDPGVGPRVDPAPGADPELEHLAVFQEAVDGGAPVSTVLRLVAERFGPHQFGLDSALPDAADQIVQGVVDDLIERFAVAHDRLYGESRQVLAALASAGYPLPAELRAPAELALARRLEVVLAETGAAGDGDAGGGADQVARRARDVLREAAAGGFQLVAPRAAAALGRRLLAAVQAAVAEPEPDRVAGALALAGLADELDLMVEGAVDRPVDVEAAQELVFEALTRHGAGSPLARLGRALGLAR